MKMGSLLLWSMGWAGCYLALLFYALCIPISWNFMPLFWKCKLL